MDFTFGSLIFSSNFDSGNLLNVEKVTTVEDENINNHYMSQTEPIKTDYNFRIWTKPDCYGTEFENSNRTWFFFSVKGYLPGKIIKLTLQNLNRQQRLYAQGYCPLYKTDTNDKDVDKWFRIQARPTWENHENNFQLSFIHPLSEIKNSVTYFAFCYPWSYNDCQKQLSELDRKYRNIGSYSWQTLTQYACNTVYYKRELFTTSLEGRRIDLITVTDLCGLCNEREEYFDEKLFPEKAKRPWKFSNKKVFVLTSRVHPGETPSSHVFNGFLNFILRPDDPRSIQLRKQFIFKLIPLLNPDGVFRGHYRTDSRGVNLNRVYLNPDFKLHSSIYAAKSLLVYHHLFNSNESKEILSTIKSKVFTNMKLCDCYRETIKSDMVSIIDQTYKKDISHSPPVNIVTVANNIGLGVDETQIPINWRHANNFLFKCNESEASDCQIIHKTANTRLTVKDDCFETTKGTVSGNVSLTDCLEVIVDIDSSKEDLEMHKSFVKDSRTVPESEKWVCEEYKKRLVDKDKCEQQCPICADDNDAAQKQSIYKFFKPCNRSNSITALADETHHMWNLKGHHAGIVDHRNKGSSEFSTEATKLPFKLHTSLIPLPLHRTVASKRCISKRQNRVAIDSTQLSTMKKELQEHYFHKSEPKIGNEGSDEDSDVCGRPRRKENVLNSDSVHLSDPCLLEISVEKSGIAFYIDLHGHCSKRGCFMYGNCLESESSMNANLLYPKLISLNSAHFDFFACNFSLRNMYTKDTKDGTTKEGAGRVAMWKHLGIVHSYTLECNYNTGRILNTIPPPSKDYGRASPPSVETTCLLPPKYTPFHFEDVGKAVAIASLDMSETNPWSRIINSEFLNLRNIREFIRKFISTQKTGCRQSLPIRQLRHPSTNSLLSESKTASNTLDSRREVGSRGSLSLSASRRSHKAIRSHLTNTNANIIRPFQSNVVDSNRHQTTVENAKESLGNKKDSLSISLSPQNHYMVRATSLSLPSNKQRSISETSKSSIKALTSKHYRLSSYGQMSLFRDVACQETTPIVISSREIMKNENGIPELTNHNRNNSVPMKSRRNILGKCYQDDCSFDWLELKKLNELRGNNSMDAKRNLLNLNTRSRYLKPKLVERKYIGKTWSISSNDVTF